MPTEHQIQSAFVDWVRMSANRYPELEMLYAIPNGGARNAITGAMLKREGVIKGVPDMHLPVARGGYHGLWLEFKTDKGKVSPEQRGYMDNLEQHGHKCQVVRTAQEAINEVLEYLKGNL